MPTLLKIDVSPRGDHSISRRLGTDFAEQWSQTHAGGKVIERDLAKTDLPYIELPWITGAYTDPAQHDEHQKAALQVGNHLIAELKEADEWLITTPMYNFAVPSKLKSFIDHITRSGQTFRVNSDGTYTGLLTGKKATVIIASAGQYTAGSPAEPIDAVKPYLRFILGFLGVTDVTFIQAGSTWKVDRGVEPRESFLAAIADQVATAAQA